MLIELENLSFSGYMLQLLSRMSIMSSSFHPLKYQLFHCCAELVAVKTSGVVRVHDLSAHYVE
jgi:hypothetical protein